MAPSTIEVGVAEGRLTVTVRDAPLDEVLQAVGDEAGIAIRMRGDLATPITTSFADVPLEDGIRKLLRGHSYTLMAGDAEPGSSIEISVFAASPAGTVGTARAAAAPNDEQARLQRIRALERRNDAAAIAELTRLAEGDASPLVRSRAVAALGRLKTQDALPPVTLALADQSPVVRVQALQGVRNLKGAAAITELQATVGYDPDPTVRRQAVRLLSGIQSPEVPWLLKQAMADTDAAVSREATRAARRWQQRYGALYGAAARIR